MSDNDSTSMQHQRRHAVSRILSTGHRRLTAIGFAGALAVMAFAGMYSLFGNASERNLTTGGSSNRTQSSNQAGSETTKQEDEMQTPANGDEAAQNGQSQSSSSTEITVNGRKVEAPANGSFKQTYTENGATTDISVDSNHSSTTSGNGASNSSSSSVQLNVNSRSSSQ